MSEEFRLVVLNRMRLGWGKSLPVAPLAKMEVKNTIAERQKEDELVVLKILATLESEYTAVLTDLEISRAMAKAALAELSGGHRAQTSLLNTLNGARYKYPYQGILLPTKC